MAELQALIDGTHCDECGKLTTLKAELGRSQRKAALEVIMIDAATTRNIATVEQADSGAANLATYLNALGINVSSETVARWLALIPTLAIELGSSLAALLVTSISTAPNQQTKPAQPIDFEANQQTSRVTSQPQSAEAPDLPASPNS